MGAVSARALACLTLGVVWATTSVAAAQSPKRYISSQAYYHAMRAELAEAQGQSSKVADELQLALVYDSESVFLTLGLARAQLALSRLSKARRHADRAVALDPKNAEAWRVSAQVAIAEGKERRAVRELGRAVKVDPTALEAWLDLARIHRAAQRPRRALDTLEAAASRVPQSAAPLAWAAQVEAQRGRLKTARRLYERALVREPRRADLVAELTTLDERLLEPARAAERWRGYVEDYPSDARALLRAARAELVLQNVTPAMAYLDRAEALLADGQTDEVVGFLLFEQGQYAAALERLEAAVATGTTRPDVRYAMGVARYHLGDDEGALADLELVGVGDLYGRSRRRIVELLMRMGRLDRAEFAARATLAEHPKDARFVALLAMVLARRGDVDAALALVRDARSGNAGAVSLIEREAWLRFRHVGVDDALDFLAEQSTESRASRYVLAEVAAEAGRDPVVRRALKQLITKDPTDARALNFLGYYMAERGDSLREAQRLVREALQIEPSSSAALDSYGWILFKRKKIEQALPYLRRAHVLEPRDPEVAEHYADALAAAGDFERAEKIYSRAKAGYEAELRARTPGSEADVDRVTQKSKLEVRR